MSSTMFGLPRLMIRRAILTSAGMTRRLSKSMSVSCEMDGIAHRICSVAGGRCDVLAMSVSVSRKERASLLLTMKLMNSAVRAGFG